MSWRSPRYAMPREIGAPHARHSGNSSYRSPARSARADSVDALRERGPRDGLRGGIRIGRPANRIPVLLYFPFDVVLHLCRRSSPFTRPFVRAWCIATSRHRLEPHLFGLRARRGELR